MSTTFYTCIDCDDKFEQSDFNMVDADFDESAPRCPSCQDQHELKDHNCDFCDQAATSSLGSTFFCDECFPD